MNISGLVLFVGVGRVFIYIFNVYWDMINV